jgi:uncharacterized protein YjbI with pentapeptide repeats
VKWISQISVEAESKGYQHQLKNPKFARIADLSDAEIRGIQTEIQDLPTELGQYDIIDMKSGVAKIKMPQNLEKFYFASLVWLKATRFKSNRNLDYAQFSFRVKFNRSNFEEDVSAQGANFGSHSSFQDCVFNKCSCLQSAKFGWAHFHSANFEDRCDYEQATFTNIASFMNSRFTNSGKFRDAKFHNTSYFDVAKASIPAVQLDFPVLNLSAIPLFLAARCMGIQIGQMLDCQAPSSRLFYLEGA